MNFPDKPSTDEKPKRSLRRSLLLPVVLSMLTLTAAAAASFAWLVTNRNIATLTSIIPPQNISVLGPNAQKLERLNLSYNADNIGMDKKVTINRIICVQSSEESHMLEVVHTTNMKGLTFNLYPIVSTGGKEFTDNSADQPMTVKYDTTPIAGGYLNRDTSTEKGFDPDHIYADPDKRTSERKTTHNHNYDEIDKVQIHAEPIYWMINTPQQNKHMDDSGEVNPSEGNNTFYVLEISWTEDSKETDVFYILAKNESNSMHAGT